MKVYRLLIVYMCMYNTIRSVMVLFHVDSQCTYTGILVTLRACARGKAIGFVCRLSSVVVTKIARSRIRRIYTCCNYHELVDIGEKLASVCFKLLNMAH